MKNRITTKIKRKIVQRKREGSGFAREEKGKESGGP